MTPSDAATEVTLRCPFCLTLNRVELARAGSRPKCGKCEKPMLLDRPVKVGEEDFERTVLDTPGPVAVDFYADWCQPCKMMAPLMDELAREYEGRILFAKVDADRAQGLSARLGIRGIPTLIVFRDGEEKGRSVGFNPAEIRALVDGAA